MYAAAALQDPKRAQFISRSVPESHIDYMMGHVTDTYNDAQSLVEKLRQEYAASGLSITSKTRTSAIETIKEILRAAGKDPERILTIEALTEGATTHITQGEYEDHHISILRQHLRELSHPNTPKRQYASSLKVAPPRGFEPLAAPVLWTL